MKIIVDENTLYQSSSGNVTAEIFFRTKNDYFPQYHWSGFPIIIMGNWLNEYTSFTFGRIAKEQKFVFHFMDGPYQMTGRITDSNRYRLTFVKRYLDTEQIFYEEETDIQEFEQTLLKACRQILRIMSKTDVTNDKIRNSMRYLKNRLQQEGG